MDVAYKQRLCSVEIYSCKPSFRSRVRKSDAKFKVVTENLLLWGEIKNFRCFSFYLFYIATLQLVSSKPLLTSSCWPEHWWIFRSVLSSHLCEGFILWPSHTVKPQSSPGEWQAHHLDCILMLLPYVAEHSGDSWGTARRSGRKGDIEVCAPVPAGSSAVQTQDGASRVTSNLCGIVWRRGQLCQNSFYF